MQIIERKQLDNGNIELTYELAVATPTDIIRIVSSILTSPVVSNFCVTASFGEI